MVVEASFHVQIDDDFKRSNEVNAVHLSTETRYCLKIGSDKDHLECHFTQRGFWRFYVEIVPLPQNPRAQLKSFCCTSYESGFRFLGYHTICTIAIQVEKNKHIIIGATES